MDAEGQLDHAGVVPESDSPLSKRPCTILSPQKLMWNVDASVKVSNLPVNFMELTFKTALEKARIKKNLYSTTKTPIKRVLNYCGDSNEVFVEFINSKIASDMCLSSQKDKIIFFRNELVIEPAVHGMNTVVEQNESFFSSTCVKEAGSNLHQIFKDMSPFDKTANFQEDDYQTQVEAHGVLKGSTSARRSILNEVPDENLLKESVDFGITLSHNNQEANGTEGADNLLKDNFDLGISPLKDNEEANGTEVINFNGTGVVYDDHTLPGSNHLSSEVNNNEVMCPVSYPTVKVKTDKVLVSALPKKRFKKESLIDWVDVEMRERMTSIPESTVIVKAVENLDHDEQTCVVVFSSIELATSFCKRTDLQFWGSTVSLKQIETNSKIISRRVLISGLPKKNFKKESLIDWIDVELRERMSNFPESTVIVDAVEDLDQNKQTCVVVFSSVELATSFVECTDLKFWGAKLSVNQMKGGLMSNRVLFTNIPLKNFKEASLLDLINTEVKELLGDKDINDIAIGISEINRTSGNAIVEFCNVEAATASCILSMTFFGNVLSAHQLEEQNSESMTKNCNLAESNTECSGFIMDESGCAGDSAVITSLESTKATWAYIKECIVQKDRRHERSFKATEGALAEISEALRVNHNIHVSLTDCKQKKRRLDENHRRNPHPSWGKHWADVRGEAEVHPDFPDDDGGQNHTLEDDVLAVAKFTKVAVMTPAQVHTLIDIWRMYKEDYWRAHKDSQFYRKISTQMVLRSHQFSPAQCKLKMDTLSADFKLYKLALNRTGQGRPAPWAFYVELQPILEGMVNVEPELTYSAGAATQVTQSRHLSHNASSSTAPERYGKIRPPAARKETTKKEDMVDRLINSRATMTSQLTEALFALANSKK